MSAPAEVLPVRVVDPPWAESESSAPSVQNTVGNADCTISPSLRFLLGPSLPIWASYWSRLAYWPSPLPNLSGLLRARRQTDQSGAQQPSRSPLHRMLTTYGKRMLSWRPLFGRIGAFAKTATTAKCRPPRQPPRPFDFFSTHNDAALEPDRDCGNCRRRPATPP
jgi:hypothetical protein